MAIVNYNSSGIFLYDVDPAGAAGLRVNNNFKALVDGTAVLSAVNFGDPGELGSGNATLIADEDGYVELGGGYAFRSSFIQVAGGSFYMGDGVAGANGVPGGVFTMDGGRLLYVGPFSWKPITLVDATTIAVDANFGGFFRVTLGGNRTVGAPTNTSSAGDASDLIFQITQDATGGRALTWDAVFLFPNGIAPKLSTTPNAVDTLTFTYNSLLSKYVLTSQSPRGGALVRALFDYFADVTSTSTNGTEDTLYTGTIAANTFATAGDKLVAEYCCTIVSSATATRRIRAYVAGTAVLDSGTLTFAAAGTAEIYVTAIWESATVLRVKAEFVPSGITLQPIITYTRITGLTITGTQIVKITGVAAGTGAASGDIAAKVGVITAMAAA